MCRFTEQKPWKGYPKGRGGEFEVCARQLVQQLVKRKRGDLGEQDDSHIHRCVVAWAAQRPRRMRLLLAILKGTMHNLRGTAS
jgi:hypothetical protein